MTIESRSSDGSDLSLLINALMKRDYRMAAGIASGINFVVRD